MIELFDDADAGEDDLGVADAGVAGVVGIVRDAGGVAVDEGGVGFYRSCNAECVDEVFFGITIAAGDGVCDFAEPEARAVDDLDALGFEVLEELGEEHVPTDDDGGATECGVEDEVF